jgi:hypothetical protein
VNFSGWVLIDHLVISIGVIATAVTALLNHRRAKRIETAVNGGLPDAEKAARLERTGVRIDRQEGEAE